MLYCCTLAAKLAGIDVVNKDELPLLEEDLAGLSAFSNGSEGLCKILEKHLQEHKDQLPQSDNSQVILVVTRDPKVYNNAFKSSDKIGVSSYNVNVFYQDKDHQDHNVTLAFVKSPKILADTADATVCILTKYNLVEASLTYGEKLVLSRLLDLCGGNVYLVSLILEDLRINQRGDKITLLNNIVRKDKMMTMI